MNLQKVQKLQNVDTGENEETETDHSDGAVEACLNLCDGVCVC